MSTAPENIRSVGGRIGQFIDLIAIIAAIILGALVGTFYGESMWRASGGPDRALTRLDQTIEQKNEFADQADREADELAVLDEPDAAERAAARRREAERLRGQIPVIERERERVAAVAEEVAAEAAVGGNALPALVAELTRFCGDLFLQILKLLVIPLVVTSMICGITSLGDVRKVGRVGAWTLCYYMVTSGIAVLLGIALVLIIKPGIGADDTFALASQEVLASGGKTAGETLLNVFRGDEGDGGSGMFPANIFLAASQTNVLALIVFALFFGGALTTIGVRGRAAIDFFDGANAAVMKLVGLVMYAAPVGIFGLVAWNIAKNGGGEAFFDELTRLGRYVSAVALGLVLHFLALNLLLSLFARRNPFSYSYGMLRAMLTAVSTSSSSATLPVTIECAEVNNKVSNRAASFVLPLGATVNMDGTALYEAIAVIFIAQSLGIPLSGGQLVVIFLTATLAAIGAAGIPQAGLVTMVMVLTAVGLPTTGIGAILAIDWFLDRLRTTVNVYGDSVGAAIIDHRIVAKAT